jgi:hypothetical protein
MTCVAQDIHHRAGKIFIYLDAHLNVSSLALKRQVIKSAHCFCSKPEGSANVLSADGRVFSEHLIDSAALGNASDDHFDGNAGTFDTWIAAVDLWID